MCYLSASSLCYNQSSMANLMEKQNHQNAILEGLEDTAVVAAAAADC